MLNKVTLIGNLGNDPEVRYMPNGGQVATLSIATTRRWRNKDTGERVEETEWHRVVLFGKLAEIAGEYLKKGSKCYIEGRLQTRKWQDKDNIDRYTTEIIGNELIMLGEKGEKGERKENGAQSTPRQSHSAPPPQVDDFDDDDIPF